MGKSKAVMVKRAVYTFWTCERCGKYLEGTESEMKLKVKLHQRMVHGKDPAIVLSGFDQNDEMTRLWIRRKNRLNEATRAACQ